jgi:hypothetical protein
MRLTKGLDPKFSDADKNLVADRPTDPSQLHRSRDAGLLVHRDR